MNKISLTKIDQEEFDSLTFESSTIALVFFWKKRCSVCKEQLSVIEQIAYEYKGKLKAYWVDVDKNTPLFHRFKLQGVPNILIFSRGEVKEKLRGLNLIETYKGVLDNIIKED